ncbi:MAG: MMPL family transporter [Chthoniobacterales bacterium]|nr:MMPL family transporter [Chthoniobacterales bacterium]
MSYSKFIARLVTERRGFLWVAVALIAAASIYVLITRMTLDSEVLNLLPGKFESVQGLKVYNNDFAQTRELTFALLCQPNDVDKLEEFSPIFAERLRAQPWTTRVLSGSPMETPQGIHDLQELAVPLLLNLEPQAFAETISILQPANLQARLSHLHQEIEAGSPRPEFELQLDSLGVVAPALKPFAGNAALQEGQPLASPDRTLRIFLAVTNQATLDAFACQALMEKVNAFRATANEGWDGGPLEILVTGRSAYVAEISLSMRHDIVVTLLGSILLVSTVFFVGFRRWLPLLGMGFSLLLCCLVALAVGLLIFHELNMVTIGMCAILIGLGVDFAILIFGRYQQARNEGSDHASAIEEAVAKLGRAIFFGALTTSVGFLALLLGGAAGFTQLGVLIAIGILVAGLFMTSVFFLFTRERSLPPPHDWILILVRLYVRRMLRAPALILWIALPLLLLLFAIAVSPKPPIIFDASTKSMEPKSSAAGYALQTIMGKMPTRWEPVIGIVRAPNEERLHADWRKVEAHWRDLLKAGAIKDFSTPAALALSPMLMEDNRRRLRTIDFAATRQALETAVTQEGFSRDTFTAGFALLDRLQAVASGAQPVPDWRKQLPLSSSWWFLVDRYFAQDPLLTVGFVTTNQPVETHAQKETLREKLPIAGVPMTLSGWSFTLTDLLPWSHHQLILISGLMAFFDAFLLAVLYRDLRLWLIQIVTLILAVGAMIATMKLAHIALNLLNVLAFRLVLAIGVDYGIYVLLVWQKAREVEHDVAGVLKPVALAGLTAIAGFGSLGFANNPTLSGLGVACAIGLAWSLFATIFFTLPAAAAARSKSIESGAQESRKYFHA